MNLLQKQLCGQSQHKGVKGCLLGILRQGRIESQEEQRKLGTLPRVLRELAAWVWSGNIGDRMICSVETIHSQIEGGVPQWRGA